MTKYRNNLPQLENKICITDGGLETEFYFHKGYELPEFASYKLVNNQDAYNELYKYYQDYALLAQTYNKGLILETLTWRASSDWGKKLGDSEEELAKYNNQSVMLLEKIRGEFETADSPIVISGCIGPRGDGYQPSNKMTIEQAYHYHKQQIHTLANTNADMVSALTINYVEEAIGIVLAAKENNIPVSISFTLETDGKLPDGGSLEEAIKVVDFETDAGAEYFMINCVHPTHFSHLFAEGGHWLSRIKGLRGNSSCLSHEELDNAEILDEGNPVEFGQQLASLKGQSAHLSVLGGCCGTDYRHIKQICDNLTH